MTALKLAHIEPANYDFMSTRAISVYKDTETLATIPIDAMDVGGANSQKKDEEANVSVEVTPSDQVNSPETDSIGTYVVSKEVLESTFKRATSYSLILTFIVTVVGASISNVAHTCYRRLKRSNPTYASNSSTTNVFLPLRFQ
jgi:hypothetical protein